MEAAIIGSFISAMATVLGAVPLFFVKSLSEKWKDILIAFTAGIMVSASTFGLMPQAVNESGIIGLTIGLLLGIVVLDLIEKSIPHIDVENDSGISTFDSKSLLVIIALFIHNIPEGLSTGFSFASENDILGPMVAISIGAQNMPEGLILAIFLMNSNVTKLNAFLLVAVTGFIEVIAAIVGYFTASYIDSLIGYGLAFAAGAMMFIVYKELIPESHGHGYERPSTYSFIIGLLAMVYISYMFT
ncbi:dihydroorotate dehydrogenase [Paenibacillus macquariensis subsp. defensor]|uniref:Zinc transporter, ZIP family n=1 Tax=Paenibacillus macquariensis TaxID=948756 RepID=A0ABY1JK40_9BACL|nr:ZIP family metal transporter [Paenibacillus macquariensis]MEC0089854.1 ZIP family metal transporter [Paenibacillus macquariensis]OAB30682.1 dihydroorotate dehydrogenase [Paenibacillus macquariensis subsp. macquariensis]OAB32695.1 dihydroorotate dehydrogenase [Paenibacillus macquariensis subsp. defensor]SIQ32704.1 zinc transporter, ZIP family [Paenibacillus macquariensis]